MSPFCINCGQEIEESYNACPNCGKVLKEENIQKPVPQAYPQPQAPIQVQPYQRSYPNKFGNTYGAVALVLGLIGLCVGVYTFGFIWGILAIALGGMGLSRDDNHSLAIVGLVLGILDIICFAFYYLLMFSFLNLFWFF